MSQHGKIHDFMHNVELSAVLSVIGIVLLFSFSVAIVLVAPGYVDKSWVEPTSPYQVQVYELADPNVYISGTLEGSQTVEVVNHLKQDFSLLAFQESQTLKIRAPEELAKYVTRYQDEELKLTSRLLLLRPLSTVGEHGETYEIYDPEVTDAFVRGSSDVILENWVDSDFKVIDPKLAWHSEPGVFFYQNPREFRVGTFEYQEKSGWRYDPKGRAIASLEELKAQPFGFTSRKDLIAIGEHIYAYEGCFYCHTDQTRTLVQDLTLNGSDSYPAPPSSANEYIYQAITFPGTKRNGPDISRVGIKRPSRDWHKAHFWSPKTQSRGSIMPAFRHFFDFDPRGTGRSPANVPNYRFEAIYQYLMTKGTRITPPTQAWWTGKDPLNTKAIIEGRN